MGLVCRVRTTTPPPEPTGDQPRSSLPLGIDPSELRRDLLVGRSGDLRRRRFIIGLSALGAAVLTLGTLRQTGLLRHLPDLPCDAFGANQVTTSDEAYAMGAPDAPVAATSYLANAVLASFGTEERAERLPWVPLLATAKAAVDVAGAAVYLRYMIVKEKVWCVYCLTAGATSLGVLVSTLPESRRALRTLARGRRRY
jgi:uncharacterized membrane protein